MCHFQLTRPCANCPFRRDVPGYIRPERVEEIAQGLERGTFSCHKTVTYDDNGEAVTTRAARDREQHCAGALILLEKKGQPSQMMRIAERLGLYNRNLLRGFDIVFNSFTEMREHMRGRRTNDTVAKPANVIDLPREFADDEDNTSLTEDSSNATDGTRKGE